MAIFGGGGADGNAAGGGVRADGIAIEIGSIGIACVFQLLRQRIPLELEGMRLVVGQILNGALPVLEVVDGVAVQRDGLHAPCVGDDRDGISSPGDQINPRAQNFKPIRFRPVVCRPDVIAAKNGTIAYAGPILRLSPFPSVFSAHKSNCCNFILKSASSQLSRQINVAPTITIGKVIIAFKDTARNFDSRRIHCHFCIFGMPVIYPSGIETLLKSTAGDFNGSDFILQSPCGRAVIPLKYHSAVELAAIDMKLKCIINIITVGRTNEILGVSGIRNRSIKSAAVDRDTAIAFNQDNAVISAAKCAALHGKAAGLLYSHTAANNNCTLCT